MLSLMSSRTPTLTGVRWSENCVTGCSSPSSNTSKSSFVRPMISRLLLSVTVTGISTVVTLPRKVWSACARPITTKAAKHTKQNKIFVTFVVPSSSWFTSRACFDPRIVILKRPHRQRLRPKRLDRRHRGRRPRQRGDAGHLRHGRRAADGAVVEERLAAERRVDDEADLPVDDLVGDVRPPLVHLVDHLDVDPVRAQERRRPAARRHGEAEAREVARDRHDGRLVAVVDADEDGPFLRQLLAGAHHRLAERRAEVVGTAHHLAGRFHLRPEDGVDARETDEREDGALDEHTRRLEIV